MNQADREILRRVVLNFLAIRNVAAFSAEQISNRINAERQMDRPVSAEEVTSAADLLVEAGMVRSLPDGIGVIDYYKATAAGVLDSEKWRFGRGMA